MSNPTLCVGAALSNIQFAQAELHHYEGRLPYRIGMIEPSDLVAPNATLQVYAFKITVGGELVACVAADIETGRLYLTCSRTKILYSVGETVHVASALEDICKDIVPLEVASGS